MSSVFDVFNSTSLTISKVVVTPSSTNQTTGAHIPESTTTTTIQGDVSDNVAIKDIQHVDPGLVAKGTRKLSVESSVALVPGDRITIVELAGDTSYWSVSSKLHASALMAKYSGVNRETFLLARIT